MLPTNTRIGILAPITWPIPTQGYAPWEKVVTNLCQQLVAMGYTNVTLYATAQASLPGITTVAFVDKPLSEDGADTQEKELRHITQSLKHANTQQDIIHNHFNCHPLLVSDSLNPPMVTTLHGSAVEPASREIYTRYSHKPYVSISDAERQYLPILNYLATVYNGIDFTEFTFGAEAEPYLVYAGRIHPDKGVHHAIELARRLGRPLLLAGIVQDSCQQYFEEQIRPAIARGTVQFLGNLPVGELQKLVAHATAYIGLIEWDEPFGLSIAEAMACGTPAIATPRGAHPEIVKDGVTGILVRSVEEAIERFPEVEAIDRKQCREAARAIFSCEQMAQGYLKVYERILETPEQYH